MCKHCKNEKGSAILCECKCSDFDWQESETIQQDAIWIKCSGCKHHLSYRAIAPMIFVGRELMKQEPFPHGEEMPHPGPVPIPKLEARERLESVLLL